MTRPMASMLAELAGENPPRGGSGERKKERL